MDFNTSTETELILSSVRRFIQEELAPHEAEVEAAGTVRADLAKELRDKAKALGLFAMGMPKDVGGGGLSTVELCLCEEEFGFTKDALVRRAFGSIPSTLVNCVGEQRQKYLFPAVRGEINVAVAMTEPNAGSDAAGIETRARADRDGYVLNGTKHFISDADVADAFVVTAVTDPSRGAKGVSAFLIDRNDDCTSIHPASNSMRPREKACCAFITIVAFASSEYSILCRPRTPSRCRH